MKALLLVAWLAATAVAKPPPLPVVGSIELARYMGTWHEIAHMPNFAQKGCTDTIVHYRLNRSGAFDLANTCWKGEKYKPYFGTARRVGDSAAKFRVKFFAIFGGNYWITDLDPEYRWAVVGDPKRDQLWVISRDPALPDEVYQSILARARALGFDTNKLERTIITGKPSKGFADE